jgi:hypothetical protein
VSKRFGFWPHITHVIVLTFKEIKHLSDYRTVGLSDRRTIGLSDCRIIGRTPPNFMVLRELGRYPIEVKFKLRMISFWSRLIQSESKLSSILYKLMLSLYEQNQQHFKWVKCVESIFNEVGLGYIFQS